MTVWRYTAIDRSAPRSGVRNGEIAGDDAAQARAALRRVGLQVIDLREERRRPAPAADRNPSGSEAPEGPGAMFRSAYARWQRGRRRHERAEICDGLATLMGSGIPLLEAVDALAAGDRTLRSPQRRMLVELREQLRAGESIGQAVRAHPAWFDHAEMAMIEAGQHGGTLPQVLNDLAERHEHGVQLGQRLASALAYPMVVAMVGLGVVVFLSVKTLPDLTRILVDADLPVPRLTTAVMGVGRAMVRWWPALVVALVAAPAAAVLARWAIARFGWTTRTRWTRRLLPAVVRRLALASVCLRLSDLLRSGIPVVEGLRVVAPSVGGLAGGLRRVLVTAADRVEQGAELSAALDDPFWFDAEFQRLVEVGEAGGDLAPLLERIGHRYERQGRRLIDRLAALLEPAVILVLAVLVGVVVMSAILPLVKLQEII